MGDPRSKGRCCRSTKTHSNTSKARSRRSCQDIMVEPLVPNELWLDQGRVFAFLARHVGVNSAVTTHAPEFQGRWSQGILRERRGVLVVSRSLFLLSWRLLAHATGRLFRPVLSPSNAGSSRLRLKVSLWGETTTRRVEIFQQGDPFTKSLVFVLQLGVLVS